MSGEVHVEPAGHGVVQLTLDNPPMNPLGVEMRATFMAALDRVEADDSLRCLVITGKGRAFCSGDDLKAVSPQGEDLAGFGRLLERLEATRAPVIAAVNGWCVGGGFELACCCDIRIASTEAKFVCAGVNVGLMASTYRLPRLIGVSRAKAMLLTGLPHDAETAERYGLTTGVYAPEALMPAALTLAERIASRAPLSVEATKRTANRAPDLCPEDANRMLGDELRVLRKSQDHKIAVAAFRERKDPLFTRS
ncbi:enoyl-CoA hydratase/isomerase family protein [Phenylobacterium sp.]|uniref:enoyl-CoA hydratase/isomerase family protein n=1 Tax=Phenylobacterium sp. TaxID=1871053 RepID=UPI00261287BA|nr:enoyl-CoA hydratase/isomerase family protein [Phenylobacterium sp.]HSC21308.1 enoyl-CoA hydratase/isomerase family protein [Solirubrobacterales bacterium]